MELTHDHIESGVEVAFDARQGCGEERDRRPAELELEDDELEAENQRLKARRRRWTEEPTLRTELPFVGTHTPIERAADRYQSVFESAGGLMEPVEAPACGRSGSTRPRESNHKYMYVEVLDDRPYGQGTPAVLNPIHVVRIEEADDVYATIFQLDDGTRLHVEGSLPEMEMLLYEALATVHPHRPPRTKTIDEHKLKPLLKAMIEQLHYQAVGIHVLAKRVGEETHHPIEDLNAAFDGLHEMLDAAIREGGEPGI